MRPQPDFIHEFVPGKSDRTLLLLHGTGGNERDLIPLGRELDPNASLLSPRGKTLENGMPRFFRRLAEGVFDLEDLQKRTHELADFVTSAAQHYKIDSKSIVALGYSNGANIAASMHVSLDPAGRVAIGDHGVVVPYGALLRLGLDRAVVPSVLHCSRGGAHLTALDAVLAALGTPRAAASCVGLSDPAPSRRGGPAVRHSRHVRWRW